MDTVRRLADDLLQRFLRLLEAGFEVMARYPHDLTDLIWNYDLYEPPDESDNGPSGPGGPPSRPRHPRSGRSIKLVPPPASQRYQAATPTRIPSRHGRRRQTAQTPR